MFMKKYYDCSTSVVEGKVIKFTSHWPRSYFRDHFMRLFIVGKTKGKKDTDA